MDRSTCRLSISVLALAIVLWAHPLGGAFAQDQMGPGMMNQGMMGPGMMNQGMMGPTSMGMGGMGMGAMGMGAGCAGMADGGMMGHPMMGQGMMGNGMMGHHMMSQGGGMGSGMMPGMMGQMMGQGMGGGQLVMRPAPQMLTTADVAYNLEQVLAMRGNARLKVGPVTEKDDAIIIGDIVTAEGSLVERYEVDRRTGIARMVP